MSYPYKAIPSLNTWTSDSSVMFAFRSSDRVLVVVDNLVAAFHDDKLKSSRPEILFHLRQALRFWIKKVNVKHNNKPPDNHKAEALPSARVFVGEDGRLEAMEALLAVADQLLSKHFDAVNDEQLVEALVENYGSKNHEAEKDENFLEKYGDKVDVSMTYLRADGAKRKYKLRFRGGKAWRWKPVPDDYVIFDSTDNTESEIYDQLVHFVMDDRGRIYAGFEMHTDWFKHSSLVGGGAAFSAGRMKVVKGVVTHVVNDSGHYQPDHRHMRNLVQRLVLYGANISNTTVRRLSDKKVFTAEKVRSTLSSWPDGKKSF
jgi:hypothetical protein